MSNPNDFNQAIIEEFRANEGKVGGYFAGAPMLLLHTVGAKSGQPRISPLVYTSDGERMVIIASKGGAPEHPGWYKNLVAHPDIEIQVRDKVIPVTARTGSAADKQRVWPVMVKQWPGYDEYQAGTTRDIPVVLLRPR